ncbi:MAG TPA: bifunctional molybdenum cofactor biosynthesis protein MoaC/MoaB [Gammaproteobacteria bacterium]|nr:bifunctional molybdenum cofactor biosynthesis protein MoaC/MoaB [Gammaproteobacteria bacterium]
MSSELPLNKSYHMISTSNKKTTFRRAIAQGKISIGLKAFTLITSKQLPKGDPLYAAEIAGVLGAKRTPETIPLCHPLNLDHVAIYSQMNINDCSITIYCDVSAETKTGVEMEALSGVNAALLTIYDLTKMVEASLDITDIRLLFKQGGKNGFWTHSTGLPDYIRNVLFVDKSEEKLIKDSKVAVITASDRAYAKIYPDKSGKILYEMISDIGGNICDYTVLPDIKSKISQHIINVLQEHEPRLIVLTGGTGLDPKDITPSVLYSVCDRIIPGIGELLRYEGASYNERSWLSCCMAGTIKNTLIIALPGSTNAVRESITILKKILPHALYMVAGGKHD